MVFTGEIVLIVLGVLVLLGSGVRAGPCPADCAVCPPAWQLWDGSCYALTTQPLSWADGREECRSMGSEMMAPRSQDENDFVVSMIESTNNDHWIACNDIEDEGQWICSGDSTYRSWADNEPDNSGIPADEPGGSDCARTTMTGEWRDRECSQRYPAVCKRRPIGGDAAFPIPLKSWRLQASCLMGHVVRELPATSISACAVECFIAPECLSFNILHYQEREKICQLSNAGRLDVDQGEFVGTNMTHCMYSEM